MMIAALSIRHAFGCSIGRRVSHRLLFGFANSILGIRPTAISGEYLLATMESDQHICARQNLRAFFSMRRNDQKNFLSRLFRQSCKPVMSDVRGNVPRRALATLIQKGEDFSL